MALPCDAVDDRLSILRDFCDRRMALAITDAVPVASDPNAVYFRAEAGSGADSLGSVRLVRLSCDPAERPDDKLLRRVEKAIRKDVLDGLGQDVIVDFARVMENDGLGRVVYLTDLLTVSAD